MAQRVTEAPSVAAEFLRRVREGLDDGLDPLLASERAASSLPGRLREAVERTGRRLRGEYHEDEWGFDEEVAEAAYPVFEWLYDHYWRVEATGAHHVPAHGPALMVANHAGVVPFDAAMMTVALMRGHALPRWPRYLVLNWAFSLPWASFAIRKVGGVPATPFNAIRLLSQGHLVGVFPEGTKGAGKPFSERYRLRRFGRGGFVEVALRTGAPIVPVAVVGSEEIYPMIARSPALARVTGAPYFPITPTFPHLGPLGLVPLPSRWRIEFCEPIDLSDHPPEAAEDRGLVFEVSERVRDQVQEKVLENLVARRSAFI